LSVPVIVDPEMVTALTSPVFTSRTNVEYGSVTVSEEREDRNAIKFHPSNTATMMSHHHADGFRGCGSRFPGSIALLFPAKRAEDAP
jgi:hypothetical protein